MVALGISTRKIRNYLHRHFLWWVSATKIWNYEELVQWFCDACFDITPVAFATGLLYSRIRKSHSPTVYDLKDARVTVAVSAA